jgi:pyruvate dehydrogenase E2 component (dihydrolipoamide acetyltransferase)
MAEVIRMPLLSDTMKEGKIAAWLKNVGDVVKSDDVLAEVETDKATMEVMGYAAGTLLHIGVPAGSAAKIDEIIAIVGKPGEDISQYLNEKPAVIKTPEVAAVIQESKPAPAVSIALPKELTIITMPLLSDTMKEGKIAVWLKNVGDTVKDDDVIAEVETDKATMEVIGYASGTLLYQGCKPGEGVPVNGTMAVVGPKGFDISPYLASFSNIAAPAAHTEAPKETKAEEKPQVMVAASTPSQTNNDSRLKASPLAKKIAQDKGISLSQVAGSGDGGRIIAKDVTNFTPRAVVASSSSNTLSNTVQFTGIEGFTDVPVTQMRSIIADRLSQSMFTAPHFYLKNTVVLDKLLDLRKQINEAQPIKISINDMIIKACALALQKHPEVNSSWMGNSIRTYQHIHIGSAIALPDGLIVPVIKHANAKSLMQIASDANVLYDKAKNKKIQPAEFTGNTFTISNLGMMDIDEFTAIINTPDAAILAVGKGTPTPIVAEDGSIMVKSIMKLTLSCDHRVIDGAVGANFLKTVKGFLENPISMIL